MIIMIQTVASSRVCENGETANGGKYTLNLIESKRGFSGAPDEDTNVAAQPKDPHSRFDVSFGIDVLSNEWKFLRCDALLTLTLLCLQLCK